tara:strand:- start:236 stop:415 length:180 start_codon:yes stop_codon:yes gene_type:complete
MDKYKQLARIINDHVRYDGYTDYSINYNGFIKDIIETFNIKDEKFNDIEFLKCLKNWSK